MNLHAADSLVRSLIQEHKLHHWSFGFDRARRRFGSCNFSAKKITLSAHLVHLNDEDQLRDTILHEISHALAGPRTGHGEVWQATAEAIGCSSMRCYGDEVVQPAAKFKGICPGCGKTILRMRRKRISCGMCSLTFDVRFLFVWSRACASRRAIAGFEGCNFTECDPTRRCLKSDTMLHHAV